MRPDTGTVSPAGLTYPSGRPGVRNDAASSAGDAPNELGLQAQRALAADPSPAEIAAFVAAHLGPEHVPRS